MTEALLRELAEGMEENKNPASKARSKVDHAEEREHYVQLLRNVQPSPHCYPSVCNLEHAVGMWEPANQLTKPISRSLLPFIEA